MEQAIPSSEQLVAVRFQAWFDEYAHGYAEVSNNTEYPPFRLCSSMGGESILSPWSKHFVTWKSLVSRDEAQKALRGEVDWRLSHTEYLDPEDILICKGAIDPESRDPKAKEIAIDMNDGYCGVKVVSALSLKDPKSLRR